MTDHPILFSAPMIRALLDGRKTQTRRALYVRRKIGPAGVPKSAAVDRRYPPPQNLDFEHCVTLSRWERRQPCDLLWVRESFMLPFRRTDHDPGAIYRADGPEHLSLAAQAHQIGADGDWKPSIHMPRWASRLTLEVTGVKIERLQRISEDDARAEGIERLKSGRGFYDPRYGHGHVHLHYFDKPRDAFEVVWDTINAPRGLSWQSNPWVVALIFKVHKLNIDKLHKQRSAA